MIQFLFICLGVGNTSRLRWGKAPPAFNLCTINGKDIAQQAKNSFIKDAAKGASVVADVKEAEKVADNTSDRKNTPNTSKTDKMEEGENQKPANESGNDKKTTNEKDKTEGENTSKEKNSSDETEGRKVTREDNGQKTGSGVETSGEVKETEIKNIQENLNIETTYGKKLELSNLTKEVLKTKPMNSPIPKKWIKMIHGHMLIKMELQ